MSCRLLTEPLVLNHEGVRLHPQTVARCMTASMSLARAFPDIRTNMGGTGKPATTSSPELAPLPPAYSASRKRNVDVSDTYLLATAFVKHVYSFSIRWIACLRARCVDRSAPDIVAISYRVLDCLRGVHPVRGVPPVVLDS